MIEIGLPSYGLAILVVVKATIRSDRIFIDIVYVNVKGTGNNTDVCSNVKTPPPSAVSPEIERAWFHSLPLKHEVKHSFIDIFLNVVKSKWSCQTLPCIKVFTNTYTIKMTYQHGQGLDYHVVYG